MNFAHAFECGASGNRQEVTRPLAAPTAGDTEIYTRRPYFAPAIIYNPGLHRVKHISYEVGLLKSRRLWPRRPIFDSSLTSIAPTCTFIGENILIPCLLVLDNCVKVFGCFGQSCRSPVSPRPLPSTYCAWSGGPRPRHRRLWGAEIHLLPLGFAEGVSNWPALQSPCILPPMNSSFQNSPKPLITNIQQLSSSSTIRRLLRAKSREASPFFMHVRNGLKM